MSPDKERRRLHSGLVAGQKIHGFHREPVALRPAAIHPQKHLRPVLGLSAPRPGMKLQVGIVGVILPGEQHFQFQGTHVGGEIRQFRLDFFLADVSRGFHTHLPESLQIVRLRGEGPILVHAPPNIVQFLVYDLRRFLVVPEIRGAHLVLKLRDLGFLRGDVKEMTPFRPASLAKPLLALSNLPALTFHNLSGFSSAILRSGSSLLPYHPWPMALQRHLFLPQQFLYFFPLPQGQGSLRPMFSARTGVFAGAASAALTSPPWEAWALRR